METATGTHEFTPRPNPKQDKQKAPPLEPRSFRLLDSKGSDFGGGARGQSPLALFPQAAVFNRSANALRSFVIFGLITAWQYPACGLRAK